MSALDEMLSQEELERLDRFLLDRIDEDAVTEDSDEGVMGISTLDGLFTALVSGPEVVPPSRWLPAVWGDFEPTWDRIDDFQEIFSLLVRHMNSIADIMMTQPTALEPIFLEREVDQKTHLIVDGWCEGYIRGVALADSSWRSRGEEVAELLVPILAFTELTEWSGHHCSSAETEQIQQLITPAVCALHAHWLARREPLATGGQTIRRSEPRAGRNDPCPCGSGNKYKRCCLQ
jgi:uncharacterized protein